MAPLYVAEGKSITSRRGVVACDSDRPEITAKDLGGDPDNPKTMKAAEEAADRLFGLGILVEAEESPWHVAEAKRLAAEAEESDAAAVSSHKAATRKRSRRFAEPGADSAGPEPEGAPAATGEPETTPEPEGASQPNPEPETTPEPEPSPEDPLAAASDAAADKGGKGKGKGGKGGARRRG